MDLPDGDDKDVAGAIQVLTDYYLAFSSLDASSILPYFHEPALLVRPEGVFAAANSATVATGFQSAMDGLRARGFGRSELRVQQVKLLSATATLVIGVALRYKLDGQELERVGVTYVLHKTKSHWKIAVLIIHDPGDG